MYSSPISIDLAGNLVRIGLVYQVTKGIVIGVLRTKLIEKDISISVVKIQVVVCFCTIAGWLGTPAATDWNTEKAVVHIDKVVEPVVGNFIRVSNVDPYPRS